MRRSPGVLGHFSMGALALEVGRPREAIRIIRQSDPNRGELKGWSSYYEVLAIAHLWLGEYDAALEAVRRLQADHPGLDIGAQLAMRTFAMQGRTSVVDSVLEAARLTTADPGGMLRYVGNVLHLAGRDGRRHYARAVRHEREQRRNTAGASPISARFALGESLLLAGALAEAETIVRARMADGARAARLLEQAWREGYSIYYNLWADPEFAAVRSHPAMRTLLTPRG